MSPWGGGLTILGMGGDRSSWGGKTPGWGGVPPILDNPEQGGHGNLYVNANLCTKLYFVPGSLDAKQNIPFVENGCDYGY